MLRDALLEAVILDHYGCRKLPRNNPRLERAEPFDCIRLTPARIDQQRCLRIRLARMEGTLVSQISYRRAGTLRIRHYGPHIRRSNIRDISLLK